MRISNLKSAILSCFASTAVAAFLIVASTPANSRTQETYEQAKLKTFEQDKLEAFVTATLKINRLIAKRQPQVDNAETEDQATALAEAAVDEIAGIIGETTGISLPEYRAISKASKRAPALLQRLKDIAKQLHEGR